MIELRALAYFDAACRSETLGLAANKLGIALSTLSAALKALEQDLGMPLFRRLPGGLYPTAAARSLMRSADPLLIVERFARRFVAEPSNTRLKVLTVDLALSFTIGGICQAIRQAVETVAAERLDVLVDPVWGDEKDEPHVSGIAKDFADADHSRVVIALADPGRRTRATVLLRDRWVLACRLPAATGKRPTAGDLLAGRIVVPALAPPLIEQADRYLRRNKITRVRFLSDHPGDAPRLIDEYSDAALFLPESLLSPRLGLLNVASIAVEKPPQMVLVAHAAKPNAVTALFLRHMRRALGRSKSSALERPGISLRQIHYFRMVQRLRRVSAAAHAVNISQPAVSEQLHKLEATLGGALFERRGDGVVPTERGDRFTEFASLMETRSRQLSNLDATAAPPPSRRIAIGILPSVNQHGFLLNRVTDAIIEIQERHPTLKLLIQEAPNTVLQDWVMRGLIGIAVVETGLPHMPRLPLGSSESLAAIAHASQALLPAGPVSLADLVRLKLVLPTARSGLRQLLDDAAAERGLKVQPHMEIDALSMAVTMLPRLPVCTVLPISAVQRELAGGDLIAHPIIDPPISRRLYAIYSAERTLSRPERELVNALRKKLAGIT
jgi:DNA-binding transcriptional LysR family regulator